MLKTVLQGLFSNKLLLVKQPGDRLKLIDFAQQQGIGNQNSRYTLMRKTLNNYSGWGSYQSNIESIELSRLETYYDYELMDTDAILSSALDIYADEATANSPTGDLITIQTSNIQLKKVLVNLFYDVLNVEYNLWFWVRSLVKNGDLFLILNIQDGAGIIEVIPLHPSLMRRVEDGDNVQFVFQPIDGGYLSASKNIFDLHEVAHFRLLSDSAFLPYGKSIIEGAKKEYKKLTLMEDAMLIHRIMRAPAKRIFKIDVGNLNPDEVDNHMEEIMNLNKKVPYIDPATGQYNLSYNIQNINEDYYFPIRGDRSGTTVETLDGSANEGSIEDIQYIRKKMMQNLKIPLAYLGEEESTDGKCVSPETLIPLISGETKTVRELIVDYENGIKNYVYSLDTETNEIRPGEIEWAGFTRLNAKVIRVILDNDKYIECTPDHKFLLRNGEWIEAQYLKPTDSLMPLYLGLGDRTVKDVVFLDECIDTCDLTIKKYHNFGTEAGVIIHNSLLAAEDVRFARTIGRIQKVIIGELYKIAYIHLMAQGFTNSELLEFEITLTNPSLIYERQKIELLKEKTDLVTTMKETNLFSRKYIYETIFNLSAEEWKSMSDDIIQDLQLSFREKQITEEGNDPKISGVAVGTPHTLAAMYVDNNMGGDSKAETAVKQLYVPDERINNQGRPPEANKFGTVKDKDLGRDPFGSKELSSAMESLRKTMSISQTTPEILTENDEIMMLSESAIDKYSHLINA